MTAVLSPQIVVAPSLTERCDSCGAAAKLEIALASGGNLAFCGHHANKYAGRLAPMAAKATLEDGFEWAGRSPSA
ncbi:DUF7455 domain-containing protein [Nucisporomicrobium flavum]|uniref:DUF7455 domain-containing protein n=1 Tax=Nucisporomicrobium flavum TaxID=2785915 RepID=UPI0018F4D45C|nr:hypothetical protein [Nucisporomicrobium flavum]